MNEDRDDSFWFKEVLIVDFYYKIYDWNFYAL